MTFLHSLAFFFHSFMQAISIAPLQVHYYLDAARIMCRSFTSKRHRQLRVKDLPKVPTWRLERDSNPRPFGRKATNLPMSHQCPPLPQSSLLRVTLSVRSNGYRHIGKQGEHL